MSENLTGLLQKSIEQVSKDRHYDYDFPETAQEAQLPPLASPQTNGNGIKRSQTIGKLVAALCKAQGEFLPVVKSNINPQFRSKYADLATIIQATMPALAKNGLAIIQTPHVNGRNLTMTTLLVHSSDEWIANELTMPATMRNELTAQTIGSACTYSRRYALQSILGVAADVDDDATEASGGGTTEAAQHVAKEKTKNVVLGMFYTWNDESQTATVTCPEEIKKAHRDVLKPLWNANAGQLVANAETLEALKYYCEQKGVELKRLKTGAEK